jgi:hypothetical protein
MSKFSRSEGLFLIRTPLHFSFCSFTWNITLGSVVSFSGISPSYFYFFVYLLIISSACSITVRNTTCYRCLPFLLIVLIYIWFIFSKSIELIYPSNCFQYLFVSSLLLTGHLPTFNTLLFRCALSFTSHSHLNKSTSPFR